MVQIKWMYKTLTVPVSPDRILAEKVRKNLLRGRQPGGTKTKVVEDCGRTSRSGLVKPNQFCKLDCGRSDCVLCFHVDKKSTKCIMGNVGNVGVGPYRKKNIKSFKWEHNGDCHK